MIKHSHGPLWVTAGICIALCTLPGRVAATTYYVTPTGASPYDGASWATAFSNVQAAADLALNDGDAIYLQWGVYSNAGQVVISNAAGVTIHGGCVGEGGSPDVYSGTNSTLTKTGGVMRIVAGYTSTVTVEGVTVSDGYFSTGANNGAGLFFTNCAVILTNCVVRDNTNVCTTASYGGGIYAAGGSLTLLDCAFHNNTLRGGASSSFTMYGGALAAVTCPLVIRGNASVFSNNTLVITRAYQSGIGGAVYASGAALTLVDGVHLVGNGGSSFNAGVGKGGALYHEGSGMAATITGCWFEANYLQAGGLDTGQGGAVCLAGATGVVAGCVFTSNYISGRKDLAGGAVYAGGLLALDVVSNSFQDNWVSGSGIPKGGGALYVNACSNARVDRCAFDGGGLLSGTAPELVYVSGGVSAVLNSTLQNNSAGRGLTFSGGAGSVLTMNHCVVMGNNGNGLTCTNGSASLFNCLLAQNVGDGLGLTAGTVAVTNCTLTENSGWGLNRSGGTGTVVNSIAWGNVSGGILSNENVSVDYSCLQNSDYGGVSNIFLDPLFVNVSDCYYLSVSGLTNQTVSSPCIDAGSNTPAFWGLDTRTTRTDGTNDTNTVVDLGYHYTNGVSDSRILTVTNCYVDAVNGNDASNGLTWGSAWRSITHALTNVAANATINVATGTYSAAESFPLTVQMANLVIIAANTNPALTVVDNAGVAGQRVLQAWIKGTLLLKGLTFQGGCFTSGENNGAGLFFQSCAVTLTNCVVRDNTNLCTSVSYGGGVCAIGGSLTIIDSFFNNNTIRSTSPNTIHGGGVAALNCPLVIRGSAGVVFSNNAARGVGNYVNARGGAIYADGAALMLDGSRLIGNNVSGISAGSGYGGAVYHAGSGMAAAITGCWFAVNYLQGGSLDAGYGGAVYLAGATGIVADCTFTNNYSSGRRKQYGGGVYASGLQSLQVVSSVFHDHWVVASDPANTQGGTFYTTNCANTVVDRCTIDGSSILAGTAPELVYVMGGGNTLFLNSILRNNRVGGGLCFAGGTATVANCTIVTNSGWGITNAGVLTVKNSIVWANTLGGIATNATSAISYTDSQELHAGPGNMNADPLFVNPAGGDYHLMSLAGSWRGIGIWANDTQMSPCIDAGEPGYPYALEPKPNGGRVNMGRYGNTDQASHSSRGMVMRVW